MPNNKPLFSLYTPSAIEVNWKNAYLLCLASRHAYYPKSKISTKQTFDTLHKWGLSNVTLISKEDTQCFTGSNNKAIFIVFRGTEPEKISDIVKYFIFWL